ncbi:MAG: winged helix-turn-helix transcriptional regulator [Candidatus Lokiarchaeota archaeon]|nr:winged helix-turn-helix transcriptional regulator [Candidatus Lokiarchaeota archaeon]
MIAEKIGIDDIDCQIMDLIQKEPSLTHTQIAEYVNRSQPTIGMRIRKLEKIGVLKFQAGINIKVADLSFARVEIQTKKPQEVFKLVKTCPFLLNAFRLSGDTNISILIAGLNLKVLDHVVNVHFRNNPDIISCQIDIIADVANDFVLPIDLNLDSDQLNLREHCCGNIHN